MPIPQLRIWRRAHAGLPRHTALISLSGGYSVLRGRLHTCYSPVRRSSAGASSPVTPRLACVRPVASVHPEPGSNSPLYKKFCFFSVPGLLHPILGLTVAFLVFLPFPAVCHKSPQRTLSLCRPSRPPAEASFPVCGCKGTRFFLFAKLFRMFFLSFFDICQTRPDFQGVAGKDFFDK